MQEDWNGLSIFQVGSVLSVAWRTLFRAPGIFIGLAFVSSLITAIVGIVTNVSAIGGIVSVTSAMVMILSPLINLILLIVIQGAIAYAVFQVIMGGRASLGESVSRSASKIFALLVLAIISGAGVGIACILLIVPGLMLMCMWYVSAPACVVERLGPYESLARSWGLTKGYRWQIFGVIVLLFLITLPVNALFTFLVRVLVPNILLRSVLTPIVTGLAMLIPSALTNVASAVAYYRLRMVKENMTMENLADVFD